MKTLLVYRHAKSDWSDPSLEDFDRPLAKRGRKAAPLMGKEMRRRGWVPDCVLCSAAQRAQETWQRTAEKLKADPQVKLLRSLYLAAPSQIMQAVRRAPSEANCVMLVGHNPGFEHFAQKLAGPGSPPDAVQLMAEKFPTAALAAFHCDIESWADLDWGGGALQAYLRPVDVS